MSSFTHLQTRNQTFLKRFINRIKNVIFPSQKSLLTDRSQELQKHAHKTLINLLCVKEELKSKINSDLYRHVESAIDPIAREAERIQKIMSLDFEELEGNHDKTERKFRQWLNKAERWVGLGDSKMNLQFSVIEAIIEQNFAETNELIDQDLQVIADYEAHILSNLEVSSEQKQYLAQIIKDRLSFHVQELANLKEKPRAFDIHKIVHWKSEINLKRTHHFELALHKIDAMIEQISPLVLEEDEGHHEIDALEIEAVSLEKEVRILARAIRRQEDVDSGKINSLLSRCQWLQHKTHEHHLDLNLPDKQSDRLDKITSTIDRINKYIPM